MATDDSGLRRTGVYWLPETVDANGDPKTPSGGKWKLWSRTVTSEEKESGAEYAESLGLGSSVGQRAHRSVESHEHTVSYELCRFPVDSSGNPQDPMYYGFRRNLDNEFEATLGYLEVTKREQIRAEATEHDYYFNELDGNTHPSGSLPSASAKSSRTEIYGRGGNPDEPEMTASPSDSPVISLEYAMQFGKMRSYRFDQPDATYLHVRSTDSTDTGVPITIETVDGATQKQLTLDGSDATKVVATSSTFKSMRVHVGAEHAGTIEVYEDDGSGTDTAGSPAQLLAYINGSSTYDEIESDRGVPMIGSSGSFEKESALPEEISALTIGARFHGARYARKITDIALTCANNLEDDAPTGTLARDLHETNRQIDSECTVHGVNAASRKFTEHLAETHGTFELPTSRGIFTLPNAYIMEGGSFEKEEGQGVVGVETTVRALEPKDGGEPIQFTHKSNA